MAGPPESTTSTEADDDDGVAVPATEAAPAAAPPAAAPPAAEPPAAEPASAKRRPRARTAAAALAAVLLVSGYAAADTADAVPGVLTLSPPPTVPGPPPAPGAAAEPAAPAALGALDPAAPRPDPGALAAAVGPLLGAAALRGSATASVVDATTGQVLLDDGAATPQEPASVAKLLTAAAALRVLGPDATIPTRVVAGAQPGQVVLVGGGDQLLAAGRGDPDAVVGRAGLADLADAVADSLRQRGAAAGSTVSVTLDDSLTGGSPQVEAGWGTGDIAAGYVAPLTSLAIDAGRLVPGRYAARSNDPGLDAARAFAGLLGQRGFTVAPAVERGGPASTGGALLGEVRSAPVADVVAQALAESDNTVAEGLARLVGAASGAPPGFASSAQAVMAAVSAADVDTTGAVLADGSGLGSGSAVPAAVFTSLLSAAAREPELRPLLPALPVGGLSGTLEERFGQPGAAGAAGLVRAKTGSLTGVTSLVGTVVDADGRLLAFAVLADATGPTPAARDAVDAVAAALATCGCGAATT
ncbi:D-alanyl-D-alanine carboxypeptidase/D-alanyl-D-alanine endopeptidase [Quadrisphaera granulorum]|uniref:D-alanyl-D-alanine carboxypeptidase/D-alanyl-D-alanine endopeptidase n=1 Tax=Quadrisphaera granulorum TaxID=317664 RepID=UPI0011B6ECF8|nr:D-alanyl-D-alanine carboxypeptidase/D-alanyl-D-alanine-endopeptidase [Quadrisphaera granulorum]